MILVARSNGNGWLNGNGTQSVSQSVGATHSQRCPANLVHRARALQSNPISINIGMAQRDLAV